MATLDELIEQAKQAKAQRDPDRAIRLAQESARSSLRRETGREQPEPTTDPDQAIQQAQQTVRTQVRQAQQPRQPIQPQTPAAGQQQPAQQGPSKLERAQALAQEFAQQQPQQPEQEEETPGPLGTAGSYLARGFYRLIGDTSRSIEIGRANDRSAQLDFINQVEQGEVDQPSVRSLAEGVDQNFQQRYLDATPEEREQIRSELMQSQANIASSELFKFAQAADDLVERRYKVDPEIAQDEGAKGFFGRDVPQGLGNMLSFMTSAYLGGRVLPRGSTRSSQLISTALPGVAAGSAMHASETFRDALEEDAPIDDAIEAASKSAKYAGPAELVPIGRFFQRLDKSTDGGIRRSLINMMRGGGEEGAQELFTEMLNNKIAQDMYDPERNLWVPGETGRAGGVGFTTGALMQFLVGLMPGRQRRGPDEEEGDVEAPPAPEAQPGEPGGPAPEVQDVADTTADEDVTPERVEGITQRFRDVREGRSQGFYMSPANLAAHPSYANRTPRGMVRLPNIDEGGGIMFARPEAASDIVNRIEAGEDRQTIIQDISARPAPAAEQPAAEEAPTIETAEPAQVGPAPLRPQQPAVEAPAQSAAEEEVAPGGMGILEEPAAETVEPGPQDEYVQRAQQLFEQRGVGGRRRADEEATAIRENVGPEAADAYLSEFTRLEQEAIQQRAAEQPPTQGRLELEPQQPAAEAPTQPAAETIPEAQPPAQEAEALPEPETGVEAGDLEAMGQTEEGRSAIRSMLERLSTRTEDETVKSLFRLGGLRLGAPNVRRQMAEPVQRSFAELSENERVAITNALRSRDPAALREAVRAPTTAAEAQTTPTTPDGLLQFLDASEQPQGRRKTPAPLGDRILAVNTVAQSAQQLENVPENISNRLNPIVNRTQRWAEAPEARVRKGAVTTHTRLTETAQELREILGTLSEGRDVAPAAQEAEAAAEPAQEQAPAESQVKQQVRQAYSEVTGGRLRAEARIADVMARLPQDVSQEQARQAITELMQAGDAELMPIDDPTQITEQDRAARVSIAGEPRHLMFITTEGQQQQAAEPQRRRGTLTTKKKRATKKAEQPAQQAEQPARRQREPAEGRETIAVKPKYIRGRQAAGLLNQMGMQVEEAEGRRALDALRKVVPILNKQTTRVFALVPTRDQQGNMKPGAISVDQYRALMSRVNRFTEAENYQTARDELMEFMEDIDGRRLDDQTQIEVLELAETLRRLRQERLQNIPENPDINSRDAEILAETQQVGEQDITRSAPDVEDADVEIAREYERSLRGYAPDEIGGSLRSNRLTRYEARPYESVPDNLMGQPAGLKQWPVEIDTRLQLLDGQVVEGKFGGLNKAHALERAFRSQPNIEVAEATAVRNRNRSQQPLFKRAAQRFEESKNAAFDEDSMARDANMRSVTQVVMERLDDSIELGMLAEVAETSEFQSVVDVLESDSAPAEAGELLGLVENAAAEVAQNQPRFADRARRLSLIAGRLKRLTYNTPVRYVNDPSVEPFGFFKTSPEVSGDAQRQEYRRRFGGVYGHGITIGTGAAGPESTAAKLFTLLHEASHAATAPLMRASPNSPEVAQIKRLFERTKKLARMEYTNHLNENLASPESELVLTADEMLEHNAWKNEREFVAEIMTNPTFMRSVAKLDNAYKQAYGEQKGIIERFAEYVTRLLSLDQGNERIVRVLTDAAWNVANAQASNIQLQRILADFRAETREKALDVESLSEIDSIAGPSATNLAIGSGRGQSKAWGAAKKGYISLYTNDQIARRKSRLFGGKRNNPLRGLMKVYNDRKTVSRKYQELAEQKFSRDWLDLSQAENYQLGQLMRDSTLWRIDPTVAKTNQVREARRHELFDQKYDEIVKAYNALSPKAQQIYRNARNYFRQLRDDTRDASIDLVERSYNEFLQLNSTQRGLLKDVRKAKDLDAIIGDGLAIDYGEANDSARRAYKDVLNIVDIEGPYLPLRRYGEYIVAAREEVEENYATQQEAEAVANSLREEAPGNEADVFELDDGTWQVQGRRLDFSIHDSEAKANEAKNALAARGVEAHIGKKLDANPVGNEGAIATMMASVNRKLAGEPEARKLLEMAFIELMADRAVHSSKLPRQNYAGAKPEEMRQAVAERAVGAAWNVADLRTVFDEAENLKALKKAATDDRVSDRVRIQRGEVVNELTRRQAHNMSDRSTSVFTRVVGTYGYMRSLIDVSFTLVNMSQTPVVAYPVIAAKYGYNRTYRAMRRAYRAVSSPAMVNSIRAYAKKPGSVTQYDLYEGIMEALRNNPRYKKYVPALQQMVDENVIDASFTQELTNAAKGGALGTTSWQRTLEYVRLLPQGAEFLNRFVTAITMLELTNGDVDTAADHVRRTQIDYSTENRPRAFKFPGGRAVMMFRMYPQAIANLLISSTYDSITQQGESRGVALRTLGGLIGTHALAGGIGGAVLIEPLRWVVNGVLWALSDDEEQTPDAHTLIDMWLAETFGKQAGEAMSKGLPSLVGVDLSTRVSLDDLLFHDTRHDLMTPEGLMSLLGPTPDWLVQTFGPTTVNHFKEGRYLEAMQRASPFKTATNISRAIELATRGVTTGQGDTVIPPKDIDNLPMQVFGTALGLYTQTPARVSERRRIEAQRRQFQTEARGRIYRLMRQATTPEERAQVIKRVRRYNQANPGTPITMDSLIQSMRQAERERLQSLRNLQEDPELRRQLRRLPEP